MLDYLNFDPDHPDQSKTFSDTGEDGRTNVVATVNYDPNKKGPPKKFTALNLSYAYFWIGSKGNDSTGMNNKSTCTIDQNVVRLLPKDESILEVKK
jgi:hypothetical protein